MRSVILCTLSNVANQKKYKCVRDGRFFTIGSDSAEFFKYKRNDIIFSADQTSQIFKYGKIINGSKRGTVFANGTAYVEGNAFSGGIGDITVKGSVKEESSSGSKSSNSSKNSNNDDKEVFDWIEIAIDRIERVIDKLDKKASNIYKKWSSRNKNLDKEISKINDEINLQERAYQRYMQQANSVGLSEKWAKRVREGKVDISTIKDKDLAEKIQEYQKWYFYNATLSGNRWSFFYLID